MATRRFVHIPLALLLAASLISAASAQQSDARDAQRGAPAPGRKPAPTTPAQPVPPTVAPSTAAPPAAGQPREATIQPRDTLNIVVLDQPAFSSKYLVGLDGKFDYPYVGRVKAAGLTVREVGEALKRLLVPNYLVNPQIAIELEQIANKRVTVTGEVRAPSEYPFAGELSLLTALTKAGSITDAAADQALVFHPGSDTGIPVNLQELMNGQLSHNIMLQDGDTILVPKAEPVYVTGEVRNPSAYSLRHGMTVQQVLALAGGLTEKGTTNGIKIQRKPAPGKKFGVTVKVKDFKIETVNPGDTIVVPRRAF